VVRTDSDRIGETVVVSQQKPEIEGVSIVLVGSFNPAIFHPVWFAREKLIQREEADRADLRIVSPDVTVFSIGWLGLEVTLDRFAARTTQIQHSDSLRDLVLGTFSLLRHTPVIKMGINRQGHFRSSNEEEWHKLGHRLAPKEPWAGLLEKPGMRRVQMLGQRTDQYQGRITVAVEPSLKLKPGFGVYFEVNDHYENDVEEQGRGCERMMEILNACWQSSLERSICIMQTLMKTP
jgi:hypothetical protein